MKKILFIIAALTLCAGTWAETQTVSYDYPMYNTPNDPKSGIASWQTGSVDATVVESSNDVVYWGTEGQTTWYVVTSGEVLTKGAVCRGDVHLILYFGALRASAENNENGGAGIEVSGSNSLTIYGQPSASLYAFGGNQGAGIGGGNQGAGTNITINGGNITATGYGNAACIGGGYQGSGSNIIINGGQVTAYSSGGAAGIGGGCEGNGTNIIINGGQVTAYSSGASAGIGGGNNGQSSNIFVATPILLKAGSTSDDAIETPHFTGYDIAPLLKDKRYVMLEEGKATAYAEAEAAGYARGKAEAKAELLGNMAEPCTDCTAVEVTDGTTTVTLYKPTNVSYIKKVKTP